MAKKTGISWTDRTWNPLRGCSRVSEGCRNCYAEIEAAKAIQRRTLAEPRATGAVRDLATELRPALARIGERIARLIAALPPCEGADACDPEAVFAATLSALDDRQLSPEHLSGIAKALTHLAESAGAATGP